MECPYCKKPMTPGKLTWHGAFVGFDGYFFADAQDKRTDLRKFARGDAFQCEDCASVLIPGRFA